MVNGKMPLNTMEMMEKLMGEIRKYNKLTGKNCTDFVIYRVPQGKQLGWVQDGAKMTWELDDIDLSANVIRHPKFPDTLHKGLVYKPFFYIPKPPCIKGILKLLFDKSKILNK